MEGKEQTVGQSGLGQAERGDAKGFGDPEIGRFGDIDIDKIERVYR